MTLHEIALFTKSLLSQKKAMLIAGKKKRLDFRLLCRDCTTDKGIKITFSDENISSRLKEARRFCVFLRNTSRYDPQFTFKSVKHPDIMMVWSAYRAWEICTFFPRMELKESNYVNILEEYLLILGAVQKCD